MACPDELTLDLWLAGALPSDEAAAVAAHVHTCAACAAAEQTAHAFDTELHAALALDAAAAQVGLGTVPLQPALGLVFGLGQALLDLIRHPALGLSQPLLALLALALLVWP